MLQHFLVGLGIPIIASVFLFLLHMPYRLLLGRINTLEHEVFEKFKTIEKNYATLHRDFVKVDKDSAVLESKLKNITESLEEVKQGISQLLRNK